MLSTHLIYFWHPQVSKVTESESSDESFKVELVDTIYSPSEQ